MNRKKNLFLNVGTAVLKQLIVVVCGFILPRYMLVFYGSATNGLVSSITHFLSFISLMELGIGPVIQANLYKPLAEKDDQQISKVIISAERFFRKIAYVFLIYIAVLFFVYPLVINREFEFFFSASLLLIIAVSTFAQYFFGMTNQLLLNADQKAYIQITLQIITVLLTTVFSIVLMKLGASVHVVKIFTAAVFIIRPLGQSIYVRKHYKIDKKILLTEEPIKQKWNGFSQHLASVVTNNIDVVLLSFFSTLEKVSVYNVYYMVTNGVTQLIMTAATGIESLFGNMYAKKENTLLINTFSAVEFCVHNVVAIAFSIAAITIVPFILVYTKGITDANYNEPVFGIILVAAFASQCLRIPYFRMIKAAGRFKETQNGAFISMGLNFIISIVLLFRFGLIGIAFGTLVAMLFHTVYFVFYLKKSILERPIWFFLKYLLSDLIIAVGSFFAAKHLLISKGIVSYAAWILYALKGLLIVLAIALPINFLMHFREICQLVRFAKNKKLLLDEKDNHK